MENSIRALRSTRYENENTPDYARSARLNFAGSSLAGLASILTIYVIRRRKLRYAEGKLETRGGFGSAPRDAAVQRRIRVPRDDESPFRDRFHFLSAAAPLARY